MIVSEFRVFAHGETFDVDAFLATTTLRPDYVWRCGDQQRHSCMESKHETSGVEFVLGDGTQLPLGEQEKIAIEYLSANREALKTLAGYPGVTTFVLGLQYYMELYPGDIGFCMGPSALLMWHALDVGIELTFYVTLDRRREWDTEQEPEAVRPLDHDGGQPEPNPDSSTDLCPMPPPAPPAR